MLENYNGYKKKHSSGISDFNYMKAWSLPYAYHNH